MHPILFKIHLPFELPLVGDVIPIRSFGVMVLLGILVASWWLGRALSRLGVQGQDPVGELTTRCLLLGFLGARLLYLIVHPEDFEGPLDLIALWKGGIVSYGGFLGGAFGLWLFTRKHGLPYLRVGDAVGPALFLGQALGRIGCLLVGDDHGRPTDLPWAITFPKPAPEGCLIPEELLGVPLHPSQLYLSAMNLVIFGVGAWLFTRRRFDGQVSGVVMVLYAVGRFLVEFTRGDDVARGFWGTLSTAQWISLAVLAAGLAVYSLQRRGARLQPA